MVFRDFKSYKYQLAVLLYLVYIIRLLSFFCDIN